MDAVSDAPGANDNASGSAAVIEAARILSRRRFPTTIVYALLSGEEQGLYGGRLLAEYARAQGWTVKAVLNNDIIGGTRGSDGATETAHVRVFSEGPRADGNDPYRAAMRREGGENDSPSRNLSRFIADIASAAGAPIAVRQVWRADRFGRGGDQLPMQEAGFPAIRIAAGIEDYDHQHQNLRTESGVVYGDTVDEMDFPYLARVTRLNIALLAALARAPATPAARVEGAVTPDTIVRWNPVFGARQYRVYRRRTDENAWGAPVATVPSSQSDEAVSNAPTPISHRMAGVRIDDWIFGVSSLAEDGSESPISSAVPGGAFVPLPRPTP
jgi:Zn-dependent M28 family amino/carboxypeptidase